MNTNFTPSRLFAPPQQCVPLPPPVGKYWCKPWNKVGVGRDKTGLVSDFWTGKEYVSAWCIPNRSAACNTRFLPVSAVCDRREGISIDTSARSVSSRTVIIITISIVLYYKIYYSVRTRVRLKRNNTMSIGRSYVWPDKTAAVISTGR